MRRLLSYLHYRWTLFALWAVFSGLICSMFFLAELPIYYAKCIIWMASFILVVFMLFDGVRFIDRRKYVQSLFALTDGLTTALPEGRNAMERDYIELLRKTAQQAQQERRGYLQKQEESLAYYTLWVHQIKTPIAAMRLVLQETDDRESRVLLQELFKIEQYADLALRYMKLTDISADLVPERCELLTVVRVAVKKYGLLFVYKNLSVKINVSPRVVISDRRWLLFILEQLLSNAAKYTKAGGITVSEDADGNLCIADTGIGIRQTDLPRIFERGFTGLNGRTDARASGIGLYLAKKAADTLGIKITVSSQVNVGTTVKLTFPKSEEDMFW